MSLQPYESADKAVPRWVAILPVAAQLAEQVANTEFVPAAMRGKPDVVTAAIMYGDEIGLTPMQALAGIHVVDGRPAPSAETMRALIFAAGHTVTVLQLTDEVCRISGRRAGESDADAGPPVVYSIADARKAGLLNRQNWQRYPRAMLLARATSELARRKFPDVVKGLGHLADEIEEPPEVGEPEPAPKQATRRVTRRPKALPAVDRTPIATEAEPAPDGSVDVPLPEVVPEGEAEQATDPWDELLREAARTREVPIAPTKGSGRPVEDNGLPDENPPGAEQTPGAAPGSSESPPDDIPRIGDRMRKALMVAYHRVNDDPDRGLRLALTSALLARPVPSYNDLTRAEALTLLRLFNDIEHGAVTWGTYPAGDVWVRRERDSRE